ncbi:hypothetical protein SLE2022_149100 [Rubroshorea leprosula]
MTARSTIFKFPVKAKSTLLLLTAAGLSFPATYYSNLLPFSDDSPLFPNKIRFAVEGIVRSSRAVSTITLVLADYKYSLYGLPLDSKDYPLVLSQVHLRSAKRMLNLCERNRGFYAKAGQFVAGLQKVSKEYSSTLSSLQDQAVPCDFKVIKEALARNLGRDLSEIFLSFGEQPIAAASIAQVHHGILKNHQEVAVKVQYPGLEQKMKLDTTVMSFLSKSVAWFFPEYRFGWLVSEFAETISLELDFIQEAKNSEKTADNFKNNKLVRVPRVFWDLTTKQVLTMQFCRGKKVDDVESLKDMKINPVKVAKALVEVFAQMIFIHGFLHGDPHPGNVLVSKEGQDGFSLVLLDHGFYKKLDEGFRLDYCRLWKALIILDSNSIQHLGEQFGVGKFSRYFPVIFTGRTIDSKSSPGEELSVEERKKLKHELKSLKMEDISSFMESLPPDFLTILKTDGILRSHIRKLGAPQRVRLEAYAKYAIYGLSPKLDPESGFAPTVAYSRLMANMSYFHLRLVLEALELLSWLRKFKQSLRSFYGKIRGAVEGLLAFTFVL